MTNASNDPSTYTTRAGLFYYFLGNINPKLRSVLRCTQLIACVTTKNLEKYGFDMVLKPFIQDTNKLSEVGSRSYTCCIASTKIC